MLSVATRDTRRKKARGNELVRRGGITRQLRDFVRWVSGWVATVVCVGSAEKDECEYAVGR